ncbi:MAG: hypothetical protein GKR99_14360 [Rhodobacteraceae bacterium]|nr:hypothetical protein [Paracoccaceae bacterium]
MTPSALPLRHVSAPVWRIVAKAQMTTPASPALAPQGRFHHTGQIATIAFSKLLERSRIGDNIIHLI